MNTQQAEAADSPYVEAWRWISANQAAGSALSLAKLLLSVWHRDHPFSFHECLEHLDRKHTTLALSVVTHFSNVGQDRQLAEIVERIHAAYPRLSQVAGVMAQAREELQKQWRAT